MSDYKHIDLLHSRRERNVMLRFTDDEYAAIQAFKPQGMETAVFLRNTLISIASQHSVLLRFTEEQMESIQAVKPLEDETDHFIRQLVLKNLKTHDMPKDFGRVAAFIVSALFPNITFEEALSSYIDFVVNGEPANEVYQE